MLADPAIQSRLPLGRNKQISIYLSIYLSKAGHSVAMVTYCATKLIPTCSPVIGQFFNTMIVASSGNKEPSKSTSWKY